MKNSNRSENWIHPHFPSFCQIQLAVAQPMSSPSPYGAFVMSFVQEQSMKMHIRIIMSTEEEKLVSKA